MSDIPTKQPAALRASGETQPPDLRQLQRWFADVMTHPGSVEDGARAAGEDLARIVRPSARMTALARMGVYHYGYRARLIECLADDFPVLRHALGVPAFDALCSEYITKVPSRGPTLDAYGRGVPSLCEEKAAAGALPAFAPELARLEWAICEVIHAPSPPPLPTTALATLEPDDFARAKLVASPALRLLSLAYGVNAYFHAVRHEQECELPALQPRHVLVQRRGSQVFRSELAPVEARVLRRLLDGERVGEVLESAAADGGGSDG
ncbi:MAG TPA: DNA-binding domain-containing protein, partial [Polyangiales bacterium]|nr:DNA-binding domain-containing protein [Polyangiales bacterium]